jgi:hypothetical protein
MKIILLSTFSINSTDRHLKKRKNKNFLLKYFSFVFLLFIISSCNNKQPFKPDYKHIGGTVIEKETCNADEADDYWIIDFTFYPDSPQIGDTLVLNGITYTNVLKVKGLDERLQKIGMHVSFDYKTISPTKIQTSGCTVANPVTYTLKELFIIHQGEIR